MSAADEAAGAEYTPQPLTNAEWREYQDIPEQGYSHRGWVDYKIAERVRAALLYSRFMAERAWQEGYSAGKRDYAGSITGGMSITTPNPYSATEDKAVKNVNPLRPDLGKFVLPPNYEPLPGERPKP